MVKSPSTSESVPVRIWSGVYMLVMSNSVLSIAMLMVHFPRWGSPFAAVVCGLRVQLTEL